MIRVIGFFKSLRFIPRKVFEISKLLEESRNEMNILITRVESLEMNSKISQTNFQENPATDVANATLAQVSFFDEISKFLRVDSSSLKLSRLGNTFDGGYVTEYNSMKNALIISCGVGNDVSFEFAASQLASEIIMFDHSVEEPINLPSNLTFHKKKIIAELQSVADIEATTLNDVIEKKFQKTDSNYSNLVLKIDIEGDEWEVLESLKLENLQLVTQLIIEFHGLTDAVYFTHKSQLVVKVLKRLNQFMKPINLHANNFATYLRANGKNLPEVIEVTYFNRSKLNDFQNILHGINLTQLNFPNNSSKPEITNLYFN